MVSFFENTKIEFWQGQERKKLKRAFEKSRQWKLVRGIDRSRIAPRRKYELLAVNSHSRLLWGREVCGQLAKFFCGDGDGSQHNGEILWVTLCDQRCVRPRNYSPTDDDLSWMKNRLRQALFGTSHFAVLDPAYYVDWQFGFGSHVARRCISWHVHALVWNISAKQLRQRLKKCKKAGFYVALGNGMRPTDVREIAQGQLPKKVGYQLKSPCSAYRVSMLDKKDRDGRPMCDKNGVVLHQFMSGKQALRPGERFTLYRIMKHLRLNDMAMAGGQGSAILAAVKRNVEPSSRDLRKRSGRRHNHVPTAMRSSSRVV